MVGDRLDTDIEGAHNAGVDSLLVMTGVTGWPSWWRPAGAATDVRRADLAGLFEPHRAPEPRRRLACGGWTARSTRARCTVTGDGDAGRLVAGGGDRGLGHLDRRLGRRRRGRRRRPDAATVAGSGRAHRASVPRPEPDRRPPPDVDPAETARVRPSRCAPGVEEVDACSPRRGSRTAGRRALGGLRGAHERRGGARRTGTRPTPSRPGDRAAAPAAARRRAGPPRAGPFARARQRADRGRPGEVSGGRGHQAGHGRHHRRRDRGRRGPRTDRTTCPGAGTSWPARWRRSGRRA